MNRARLAQQLILHEGFRRVPYIDTEKNVTVGVGYNVTARGWKFFETAIGRTAAPASFTDVEVLRVLAADIDRVETSVRLLWPFYIQLDEVRQRVACDLAFNLGHEALAFTKTIAAVKERDWSRAARELYKSKWATQVDDGPGGHFGRADRLAKMLLTGQDYTE